MLWGGEKGGTVIQLGGSPNQIDQLRGGQEGGKKEDSTFQSEGSFGKHRVSRRERGGQESLGEKESRGGGKVIKFRYGEGPPGLGE